MENLLNILLPQKCIVCEKGIKIICRNCLEKCKFLIPQLCLVCDRPSENGFTHLACTTNFTPVRFISIYEYINEVRVCIKKAKYKANQFSVLSSLLDYGFTQCLQIISEINKTTLVIPVPLSRQKLKTRHFNQAEVIAKKISNKLGLTLQNNILIRIKNTNPQFEKTRNQRYQTLAEAFSVVPSKKTKIKNAHILLIDDICTTGATLLEISKVLYNCNVASVTCFTLCKRLKTKK